MTRIDAAFAALFLAAIVAANLLIARFGPPATPYVAFALIGLDLVARDRLHLSWSSSRRERWVKLGILIGLGGLLAYLVNADAGRIALASVVAFTAAGVTDTFTFQAARKLDTQRRVNTSNVFAAAVDTLVFFAIAFGLSHAIWAFVFAQFFAKVAGGTVWALLLHRALHRPVGA